MILRSSRCYSLPDTPEFVHPCSNRAAHMFVSGLKPQRQPVYAVTNLDLQMQACKRQRKGSHWRFKAFRAPAAHHEVTVSAAPYLFGGRKPEFVCVFAFSGCVRPSLSVCVRGREWTSSWSACMSFGMVKYNFMHTGAEGAVILVQRKYLLHTA